MLREYDIDLRFALWGEGEQSPTNPRGYVGVRRLLSLIDGLPLDCAYRRSVNPALAAWSAEANLLRTVAQLVDQGNRDFAAFNSQGKERRDPIQIPHPLEAVEEKERGPRRQASHEEIMAFFGGNIRSDGDAA